MQVNYRAKDIQRKRSAEKANRSHTKGMVERRLGVAFESALSGSKPEVVSS